MILFIKHILDLSPPYLFPYEEDPKKLTVSSNGEKVVIVLKHFTYDMVSWGWRIHFCYEYLETDGFCCFDVGLFDRWANILFIPEWGFIPNLIV